MFKAFRNTYIQYVSQKLSLRAENAFWQTGRSWRPLNTEKRMLDKVHVPEVKIIVALSSGSMKVLGRKI
jgi:hypothetical protein